jgi:hypothetical protein
MRTTRKLGLAAAVLVSLVIGFSAPAGAAGAEVVSGTLTTVLGDFDLTPGSQGPGPCPDKADTLTFTTTAGGTWQVAGTFSGQFQFPAGSGNWYQADFTMLAGSQGNWGGAAPTQTLTGNLIVRVDLYLEKLASDPTANCTKSNLRCRITGAFALTAASTYKSAGAGGVGPGLPTTTAGDLATITANTFAPLQVANCTAPWNGVAGTAASLTNAQFKVL